MAITDPSDPGESVEMDNLEAEGLDLPEPEVEEPPEASLEEGEGEEDGEEEELSSNEDLLASKDAEIEFLRTQVARREAPVKEEPAAEDEIDYEALTAKLVDKDPKVGAKAIVELVKQISTAERKKILAETGSVLSANDQVRSAKESDRNAVMEEFSDYFADPKYGKQFLSLVESDFQEQQRATGGRYVPRSLYRTATLAKARIDAMRAKANGTKNGVREVRPNRDATNTTTSSTVDYSKAKTISDLPDMTPREKAIARATAKRMGVSESEWVKYHAEQQKELREAR